MTQLHFKPSLILAQHLPAGWLSHCREYPDKRSNIPDLTLRASRGQIKVDFQVYEIYCKNCVYFSL